MRYRGPIGFPYQCLIWIATLSIYRFLEDKWYEWCMFIGITSVILLLGLLCWRSRLSCCWTALQATWRLEFAFLWRLDWYGFGWISFRRGKIIKVSRCSGLCQNNWHINGSCSITLWIPWDFVFGFRVCTQSRGACSG